MRHIGIHGMDRKSFWIVFVCLALLLFFMLIGEASVSPQARGEGSPQTARPAGAATVDAWTAAHLRSVRTPDKINVFAFGSCTSPKFRRFRDDIELLARQREDLAMHIIDLGYQWELDRHDAEAKRVVAIPHVLILERDGTILAADNESNKEGLKLLGQWMRELSTQARAEGSTASLCNP